MRARWWRLWARAGAGKSSLLHLLAALDTPTAGEVWCGETPVELVYAEAGAEFRNRDVGYVWQFHYLLPEFTALENVAMPLLARGDETGRGAGEGGGFGWGRWGWGTRAEHRSGELSGGEQQRVSLARALVTGAEAAAGGRADGRSGREDGGGGVRSDSATAWAHGLTSVMVTHNLEFAGRCDRMLRLREGRLETARAGKSSVRADRSVADWCRVTRPFWHCTEASRVD